MNFDMTQIWKWPTLSFPEHSCLLTGEVLSNKYLKSISKFLGRYRLPKAHTLAKCLFLLAPNFCRCQGDRLNLTLANTEGCTVMLICSLWYFKLGNMRT